MNEYKNFILHLSLINEIGPVTVMQVRSLLKKYSIDDIYQFKIDDFLHNNFSQSNSQRLVSGLSDNCLYQKELELLAQHLVSWTVVGADDYPSLLGTIYAPPAVLYWYGKSLDRLEKNCAVVGSRNCTAYGRAVVDYLIESLVEQSIVVISGGAFGIDAAAHEKTIALGGTTLVVSGSGLLNPYPFSHKKLFETVVSHGGTVSSIFPLCSPAHPGNFPARNRVISGMSSVIVVVQAAEKSGALITAHHALEQGRSVFVVPGSIFEPMQKGCHNLAMQGASIMTSALDILHCFGVSDNTSIDKGQRVIIKNESIVDPLQAKIFTLCIQKALNIDEIIIATNESLIAIQSALFQMQLADQVKEVAGGRWIVQG